MWLRRRLLDLPGFAVVRDFNKQNRLFLKVKPFSIPKSGEFDIVMPSLIILNCLDRILQNETNLGRKAQRHHLAA